MQVTNRHCIEYDCPPVSGKFTLIIKTVVKRNNKIMIFLDLFTKKSEEIASGNTSAISLLEWQVNAETCTLTNLESGAEVRITPRGMEVLMHLIGNPEQVISANELLDLFWSKSVRSDHAVHNVIAELRAALGDRASNPKYIKTYPKRGYALLPAPSIGVNVNGAKINSPSKNERSQWVGISRNPFAYASILLLLVAASIFYSNKPTLSQATDEPMRTLLVRDFESVNLDSDVLYLSQQLPGSLVSSLSLLPRTQVAVKNGSFGIESQADYLLNGNIQGINGQNRLQINLTDARTKLILFSDQFNFTSEEIFSIQDRIVQHVATALRIYLDEDQRNDMHDWGTNSAVAYDSFLKAEFFSKESNSASLTAAIENYLFAVEKDPDFVNAYVGLATIAARKGIYSNTDTNVENRRLVNFALRELLRIDPESQEAQAAQFLALRVEGNNQQIIEEKIRNMILDGVAPQFSISHYSALLTSAKLFSEAEAFLETVPSKAPHSVSPDATWTYRNDIVEPHKLIPLQKQQLLVRPSHIGVLGSLACSYAFIGDYEQAKFYLSRQLELDTEGQSAMLSQVIISALFGASTDKGDELEAHNKDNPEFNFAMGVKQFILADIDAGIELWRDLTPSDNRRLFAWLHSVDIFFPLNVLNDTRYKAILEEIGIGETWQKHLMKGVIATSSKTGVSLSESSQLALAESRMLHRNNLWNHEKLTYPAPLQLSSHSLPRASLLK